MVGAGFTILETDWEGDTRSELTMKLRLGGTSTDSTPRNKVSDVLGRDSIEKFGSNRDAKVCEVAQELTGEAKTLVDLEGAIEVWVIDETLPSDSRPWFLGEGY